MRICFVHIPKCGGTSIRQALLHAGYYSGQHGHRTDLQHKTLDTFCNFETYITQVRNPYERAVSQFNFMHRQYHRMDDFVKKEIYDRHIHLELNEWVKLLVDDGEEKFIKGEPDVVGLQHPRYCLKPQHWWIGLGRTMIFKLEDQSIWNFFYERGMDVQRFHSRRSFPVATNPVLKTRDDLTRESIDIINSRYEEDFRRFNYEQI